MPVIFDEVVGEVRSAEAEPGEQPAPSEVPTKQTIEILRRNLRRLEEREARLRAD